MLKKEFIRKNYSLDDAYKNLGLGKTYHIKTYGCQANVRDSETLAGLLQEMGFKEESDEDRAYLLIFNTCAVRKAAEDHVLGQIGNLKHAKMNSDRIFALCGCMAQEEVIQNLIKKQYPQVDLVFGTHNLEKMPEYLKDVMEKKERVFAIESIPGSIVEGLPVQRANSYKAYVNIMYGCNKFCTYCIVPYTRGRERSRYSDDIVKEIADFKEAGGKEVVLLGQNVNAYGKDLGEEDGFTKLLEKISDTGIERIRFYTSHPRDYSASTIEAMKQRPNIMNALHLPVQSGSNEVLRRMARGYTVESYKTLYDDMKARIGDISFTTDIIVGFPGETEDQFKKTLDLVDYCRFDLAYTFVYSPRSGTPASKMEDNVTLEEKKERLYRLNEKVAKYAKENNEKYVGKTLEVLCEGPSKKNKNVLSGYSRENKLVNFVGKDVLAGDIVRVKIKDAKSYSLDGETIE